MTQKVSSSTGEVDPRSSAFGDDFGAFLQASGILDMLSVARARRAAATAGERFDRVLTKLGLISEADLAASLSRYLGLPLYVLGDQPPQRLLDDKLPLTFVVQNRVLPIRLRENTLTVAAVDPFDRMTLDSIRFVVDQTVQYEIIAPADFDRAVAALRADQAPATQDRNPSSADDHPSEHDLQRLRDSASEAPVIRLVNRIIADAVDARASDIHIEPDGNSLLVRYRIDGMLRTAEEIPARLRAAVISRIKILAKLDIAERRLPQDGRIKLAIRGNEIDFRTATIPTMNGESVVMRVLDRNRVQLEFETLGFEKAQIGSLQRLMQQTNGIILVTGPTGSGKTTTLYTMLKQLNGPTVKIFTVEDPIEYQLNGINQVQVQQSIGLDFPACLRAILRQDPDMLMIGEIRDAETARIAVQASLTGHLVFSTLHTNSAAESVTRLIDMGIENFLIGSTIRGIMAQRLVRRLCLTCAQPHERANYWTSHLTEHHPAIRKRGPPRLLQSGGCEKCNHSGFRGRLSVAELLLADEGVQQAILRRAPAVDIEAVARSSGMISMYEDGIAKAWGGLTTIEEVIRVADPHERESDEGTLRSL